VTVAHPDWPRSKTWIEAAISLTPFYNIEAVERGIEAGEYHFWAGEHGAGLTEFVIYPNGKALNIFAAGGDTNQALVEFLTRFEPCWQTWAKAADCRWIIASGREGWGPSAKMLGYTRIWSSFMKELR
jgi:hypothetical protein